MESLRINVIFIVVDAPASYNSNLGRDTKNTNKIIPSIVHQKVKFISPHGVGDVFGRSTSLTKVLHQFHLEEELESNLGNRMEADTSQDKPRPSLVENLIEMDVDNPNKKVRIGAALVAEQNTSIIALPKEFYEFFACHSSDILGICTNITFHELKVDPTVTPIA